MRYLTLIFFLCCTSTAVAKDLALYMQTFRMTGMVQDVDRQHGRWRYVIVPTALEGMDSKQLPRALRVTSAARTPVPLPGDQVSGLIRIGRPQAPMTPDGFDGQKWFYEQGIDATGFVMGRLTILGQDTAMDWHTQFWRFWAEHRFSLSETLFNAFAREQTGAVAVALLTGVQGYLSKKTEEQMRIVGLTHLLSVSGMNMAMVAGLAFGVFRMLLVLWPGSMRWPVKKYAAVFAWVVAVAYYCLTGGGVPTLRALLMTTLVLLAVLLDRQVVSLWSLLLAAVFILITDTQAITGASFQLSFTAVLTLILFYQAWQRHSVPETAGMLYRRLWRPLTALLVSTGLITLTTAPIGAYHFQTISVYGVLANMLAVPLTGVLIMPLLGIILLLLPLQAAAPVVYVADLATWLMLYTAETIADLPYAQLRVLPMSAWVPALLLAGLAVLFLSRHWWRITACVPVLLAFWMYGEQPRPILSLTADGQHLAWEEGNRLYILAHSNNSFIWKEWPASFGYDSAVVLDPRKPDTTWPASLQCETTHCTLALHAARIVMQRRGDVTTPVCDQTTVYIAPFHDHLHCDGAISLNRKDFQARGAHQFFMNASGLESHTRDDSMNTNVWTYYK